MNELDREVIDSEPKKKVYHVNSNQVLISGAFNIMHSVRDGTCVITSVLQCALIICLLYKLQTRVLVDAALAIQDVKSYWERNFAMITSVYEIMDFMFNGPFIITESVHLPVANLIIRIIWI